MLLPTAQVSDLTTGAITLPSARGAFTEGDYDLIATLTSDGSTAQFIFTDIPQTYRYLEVKAYGSVNSVSAYRNVALRVNSVATSIYTYRWVVSNTNSMSANASSGATEMPILQSFPYGLQMGIGCWTISNYTSSNAKTVISWGGGSQSTGTEGELSYGIGTAVTSSANTSLMFFNATANTWTSGTEFSLYGVS